MFPSRMVVTGAAALLVLGCGRSQSPASSPVPAPAAAGGAVFTAPVSVLPPLGYGFEPSIVADRFGNLYVTAHKSAPQMVLSNDLDAQTLTRSMSWTRRSADGGATWSNMPGLTALALEGHFPGVEGDFAFDDVGRLYHADTFVLDVTLTRWTPSARGEARLDFANPAVLSVNLVDDRPWITAHGDGHVLYLGNEGLLPIASAEPRPGSGFGPGSFWAHASLDGGRTFEHRGYPLKDSSMCRPASDARSVPGTHFLYAICADLPPVQGPARLAAFVSTDEGQSFERHEVAELDGYLAYPGNPCVQVAADGTVYVLYLTHDDRWLLLTSRDHARSWQRQDITPAAGRYARPWLALAPDGRLGVGTYHAAPDQDWFAYGAIWRAGETPVLVNLDPAHPVEPVAAPTAGADYMGSSFDGEGRLHVVWDRAALRLSDNPNLNLSTTVRLHEVWHARTR